MSEPTPQEARSRQTASEAERHWWAQQLRQLAANCRECHYEGVSVDAEEAFMNVAAAIEAIIAERTR